MLVSIWDDDKILLTHFKHLNLNRIGLQNSEIHIYILLSCFDPIDAIHLTYKNVLNMKHEGEGLDNVPRCSYNIVVI